MKASKATKGNFYRCEKCHGEHSLCTPRCPSCSAIYTLTGPHKRKSSKAIVVAQVLSKDSEEVVADVEEESEDTTVSLDQVPDFDCEFIETGIESLDDVLGGGVFRACAILLGADPGTGKSTLVLQIANAFVLAKQRVLLCLGEEHPGMVKARIKRLGFTKALSNPKYFRLSIGKEWEKVTDNVDSFRPDLWLIDSADRFAMESVNGGVGSDRQKNAIIVDVCDRVHEEDSTMTAIALSHFNEAGEFKGATANEHDVDATLIMRRIDVNSPIVTISTEGKNRFGETGIVRYMEMQPKEAKIQGLISIEYKKSNEDDDTSLSD